MIYILNETSVGQLTAARVPEHLVILQSCNAGFEPSLARAFLTLGTTYVLGYVKPVVNVEAGVFVFKFLEIWFLERAGDPRAIPAVFETMITDARFTAWARKTLPVLFSATGMRCYDLPHYVTNAASRGITYAYNVRPYWVYEPR